MGVRGRLVAALFLVSPAAVASSPPEPPRCDVTLAPPKGQPFPANTPALAFFGTDTPDERAAVTAIHLVPPAPSSSATPPPAEIPLDAKPDTFIPWATILSVPSGALAAKTTYTFSAEGRCPGFSSPGTATAPIDATFEEPFPTASTPLGTITVDMIEGNLITNVRVALSPGIAPFLPTMAFAIELGGTTWARLPYGIASVYGPGTALLDVSSTGFLHTPEKATELCGKGDKGYAVPAVLYAHIAGAPADPDPVDFTLSGNCAGGGSGGCSCAAGGRDSRPAGGLALGVAFSALVFRRRRRPAG
jgi:MYXO-CTERM domain-containing protein